MKGFLSKFLRWWRMLPSLQLPEDHHKTDTLQYYHDPKDKEKPLATDLFESVKDSPFKWKG